MRVETGMYYKYKKNIKCEWRLVWTWCEALEFFWIDNYLTAIREAEKEHGDKEIFNVTSAQKPELSTFSRS